MFVYFHPAKINNPLSQTLAKTAENQNSTMPTYSGNSTDFIMNSLLTRTNYVESQVAYDSDKLKLLLGSPFGFTLSSTNILLYLIADGLFDRHPELQVILGHNGEILGYWAFRLDHRYALFDMEKASHNATGLETDYTIGKHGLKHYFQSNILITTSGMFNTHALNYLIAEHGYKRIMFSMDTPYEFMDHATSWYQEFAQYAINHNILSCAEINDIAFQTAYDLFMSDKATQNRKALQHRGYQMSKGSGPYSMG